MLSIHTWENKEQLSTLNKELHHKGENGVGSPTTEGSVGRERGRKETGEEKEKEKEITIWDEESIRVLRSKCEEYEGQAEDVQEA